MVMAMVLVVVVLATALPALPASSEKEIMLGFSEEAALRQLELEAQFDGLLNKDNLREWMQRMTVRPNHVGSPYGKQNAEFVAELFQSWGFDTETEVFHVLFPTPKLRRLEMIEPITFTASLREPPIPEDSTSGVTEGRLPPYNAYSADGDVTAELVYVNYGVPDDYEALARRGIDVRGRIVIARYGGSWRGIKPKVAAEHGAVGCIIYSDPRDDGYYQGDVYPKGPFRNENGAQRGSVVDMPIYPGDPLTPGVGATEEAKRLSRDEAPTLVKIPVLPISYADALPLLRALEGPVAPEAWRGALPITYHLGPGPAKVRLQLEFNWDLVPAYNVIARLRGSEFPDQWVIRGNHRDAWVFGADDPISGMVALMEEARAVGELARRGWRPRRTLVYCSWDAEEPGLLGSTEWVEAHAAELRKKAVVYINSDSNARGFLFAGGSHTLEAFVNETARAVADPQTGVTVSRRRLARLETEQDTELEPGSDFRIAPLGSGSDYTPFLQHLGITTLNVGYGGEDSGGSYHSVYDSFDHYSRFGDPDFQYGITLAQTAGRLLLRMAQADLLPLVFENFAASVGRFADEISTLLSEMRVKTERENKLIRENAYVLAADPKQVYVSAEAKGSVPYLNFAPLQNALARLKESARAYDRNRSRFPELSSRQLSALNGILMGMEAGMTLEDGLPGRPWFRHQIYAPGMYTGYGVKTLPGIREAVEQRDWEAAGRQIDRVAEVLEGVANEIDQATELLSGSR